jgi:molybdopterin-guanine dinucleotide biosynthesis protein A
MTANAGIAAVILAGGLARRMGGGDKPLIRIGGQTMLSRVVARIGAQVAATVLNANGDPSRFAEIGLPVTPDGIEGHAGPLAGILAGLEYVRAHHPDIKTIVSIAGDTPFFPEDLVAALVAQQPKDGIVLAESGDRVHPVFGLWPVALADDLRHFLTTLDNRKVLAFVDGHPNARAVFAISRTGDRDIDPFFNVNTPEDIAEAEAILARDDAAAAEVPA